MDEETLVKAAAEGGEIQAVDVTVRDKRRLARLKAKAEQGNKILAEVVDEGAIN